MSQRVLLCDDELHILRAAEFKLKRSGYDVVCACDGEDGWEKIQEQCPDILVTDCQMPRLDGLGLAKRIRENAATSHLPVVMLTAKGFELSRNSLQEEYGIVTVLAKPFSPRELAKCVAQVLESGSYQPTTSNF
jgi:two-component system alkaline phosphatase synthesis response regulator PhoP